MPVLFHESDRSVFSDGEKVLTYRMSPSIVKFINVKQALALLKREGFYSENEKEIVLQPPPRYTELWMIYTCLYDYIRNYNKSQKVQ